MKSLKPWSAYGLKWNPFSPDVPIEALSVTPRVEQFCWRVENQIRDGGFALITGDPGLGKSVTMRLLADRLSRAREINVGTLTHPGVRVGDFYRELGDLYSVSLTASNRWGGFKVLREKWLANIEATLMRPVLLVDEAQDMHPAVLSELRLLSSTEFDSRSILTVVLSGDGRLPEKFRDPELLPIGSRLRSRITHEYASRDELLACISHRLAAAGNTNLMTHELMETLCEHAGGNYRTLFNMASELVEVALQRDVKRLDEKLFLEVFSPPAPRRAPPVAPVKTAARR
jgi:type II secretory pathway predicted ATPase ExeA